MFTSVIQSMLLVLFAHRLHESYGCKFNDNYGSAAAGKLQFIEKMHFLVNDIKTSRFKIFAHLYFIRSAL